MMKAEKKHSTQILRAYMLIEVLGGHEFDPLSTGDVARAMQIDAPTATRHLQAAEAAFWVEKTIDGKWRLYPRKMTNIAVAVTHGIQKAKHRLDDEANNYTRSMI